MPLLDNRIRDTTTTTGTGNITVSGTPVAGYLAFSNVPTGAIFDYTISGQSGSEFEVGRGKMTSSTAFSRDKVLSSSNSGSLVNFGAGTKDVFVTMAKESIQSSGRVNAAVNGWGVA
jgi:hypothetical protein